MGFVVCRCFGDGCDEYWFCCLFELSEMIVVGEYC